MASQQIDSREAHRRARAVVTAARERLAPQTAARTAAVSERLERVLEAFAAERVGTQHFASLTGYGHGDQGREVLDRVFARVLGAEKAAVRLQFVSGTHAIAAALFGVLRPGDQMLSITGRPYDTLEEVIGLRGEGQGSLAEFGVAYDELELTAAGAVDEAALDAALATPRQLILCVIGAALPFFFVDGADPAAWAYPIGIGAVVSAALQVVWSLLALRGWVRWTTGFAGARDEARRMLMRMLPVIVGLGTLQLNSLMDTLIAMYPSWVGDTVMGHDYPLDESSNAILFYAQRLYQFPLGVFGIAVATAAFPALARVANDPARFGEMLRRGLRLSLFIGVPASVGLLVVGGDLVSVLYRGGPEGGGFSAGGTDRAASVLAGYSVAVWAYALNQLLTRAFYARNDTRTPMTIALGMVGVNLALNCTLIWWLREAGLAWSTALCAIAQGTLLLVVARRRLGVRFSGMGGALARVVLGSVLMGAGVLGVRAMLGGPDSWWAGLAGVLGMTLAGTLTYALWARITNMDELGWLLSRSTAPPEQPPAPSPAQSGVTDESDDQA